MVQFNGRLDYEQEWSFDMQKLKNKKKKVFA